MDSGGGFEEMRNSLTAKRIEKLLAGKHPDGQGLYCLVAPTGGRSWALKYEPQGRERWHGLGPCHTFKPEEARQRARKTSSSPHCRMRPAPPPSRHIRAVM
jgi:hypothetical protein